MYLLYLTVYYLLSIHHSTTSYVLLAANIEDFRSLAKKFVPGGIADSIFAVAAEPESQENTETKYAIAKTYDDESQATERSREEQETVKLPFKQRNRLSRHRKTSTTLKFDIDELVERVKERLQKEMTLFATTVSPVIILNKDEVYTTKMPKSKIMYESRDDVKPIQPHTEKRLQVRYVKQSRNDDDNKQNSDVDHLINSEPLVQYNTPHTKATPQLKYLKQESEVIPQLKHASRPEKHKQKQFTKDQVQHENKKYLQRKTTSVVTIITETEAADKFFQGFDLAKVKDSYEDYKIPEKDESYDEPVPSKPIDDKKVRVDEKRAQNHTVKEGMFDIFSDADETPRYNNQKVPDSIDEEETTNDSKKKNYEELSGVEETPSINENLKQVAIITEPQIPAILPAVPAKLNQPVLTYAEQIVQPAEDGTQATTPDSINAPTESASIEENDNIGPFYKEVYFNVTKTTRINGKKTLKPQKAGTIIPKRDFYKLSSPNYLGKLPVVVDKYEFDEPIPEQDREPEHLKPVGNPPASINGKVKLF